MSHFSSQGEEILNRLNSRSVLESFYRMNADVEGIELDEIGQDIFSRVGFSRGGKPGQFNPPSVTLKKSKVSMETLNLMKKHLQHKGDDRLKWVPNGQQKQSKVFHASREGNYPGSRMSHAVRRNIIYP